MSLNWDATKTPAYAAIKDDEDARYTDEQARTLDALIWSCLVVDMPGFTTNEEADEFYLRMQFTERLGHAAYKPLPTREQMQEWVGLRTNVSRKTWNQFTKRHLDMWRKDNERAMERTLFTSE